MVIRMISLRRRLVVLFFAGAVGVTVARADSRLNYLEGDGEAYIQTEYVLTSEDTVEIEFTPLADALTHLFGSRTSASADNFSLSIGVTGGGAYDLLADCSIVDWSYGRLSVNLNSLLNKRVRAMVGAKIRSVALCDGAMSWENTFDVTNDGSLTTPGPACLFYLNGAAFAGAEKFRGRIYTFVVRRNGEVVLSLVPYEKAGVCGMMDEESGKFYGNAAKTGAFVGEGPSYKPVEYIKGDGIAYIDTGTPLTGEDRVEMAFELTQMKASHVFGSRASATEANFSLSINSNNLHMSVMCDFNSYDGSRLNVYAESLTGSVAKVECSADLRKITRYSTLYEWFQDTPMPVDFVTPGNCYLYYMSGATYVPDKFTGKVYSFAILRDGKRRLDLVPWRFGFEYGFRDKVSGRFFGNANPEGGKFCEKPPQGLVIFMR